MYKETLLITLFVCWTFSLPRAKCLWVLSKPNTEEICSYTKEEKVTVASDKVLTNKWTLKKININKSTRSKGHLTWSLI